jgi:predicted NACHT family NTPase
VTFLGDPGAGKSIFVRIVIARVIDGTPPPGVSTELLPVLIVLRDLVQRLVSIDLDALPGDRHAVALATAVRDQIIADLTGLEAEGFDVDLREAFNAHRCLLVFDDLDEVRQEWRGLVQRAVVTVINHYQPHRVSVTCRTRSYLGDATLPGFNAFTLTPFDAKQFASFARAWYNTQRELGRVDAVQARQKGTNLAAVTLQPALRALAANPMLLTAMALIHQQDTRHPEELLFNNIRNGARELFYLAAELLEDELPTQQMQRAALWSGQMGLMASGEWIKRGARTPQRGKRISGAWCRTWSRCLPVI